MFIFVIQNLQNLQNSGNDQVYSTEFDNININFRNVYGSTSDTAVQLFAHSNIRQLEIRPLTDEQTTMKVQSQLLQVGVILFVGVAIFC